MKFRRMGIYLITALLALVTLFLGGVEKRLTKPTLTFIAETEGGSETIHCWEREDGAGYVFLPGFVEMSSLYLSGETAIILDGEFLEIGADCGQLQINTAYSVDGVKGLSTLTFLRSQNLPALYIDTDSKSMSYVHEEKTHKESGALRLYDNEGNVNYQGRFSSIKMRGNNYRNAYTHIDKKPYNLTLFEDGDLLGMGAAKNWALHSDTYDPTHLRNQVVMDTARKLGLSYTPQTKWVDLFLNGEYVGLYRLSEKNEVHPNRVDIEGDGFLVSQELWSRMAEGTDPAAYTNLGAALRIRYNSLGEISLENTWYNLESAISQGDAWWEFLDQESWTKKYLIEEVFGNLDGGSVSQFFYMDTAQQGGKIFAGPVWDYDMAMGNPFVFQERGCQSYNEMIPNIFYVNPSPDDFGSPWYSRLYQQPRFYEQMVETYRTEMLPLIQQLLDTGIQQYAQEILSAAHLDEIRWNAPNTAEQIQRLAEYLSQRTEFLNKIWLENQAYLTVRTNFQWRYTTYILFPGDHLPTLPVLEGYAWYEEGQSTAPLDMTQPIYRNMRLELREISSQYGATDAPPGEASESTPTVASRRNWALWIPVLSITTAFLLLFFTDILRTIRRYRSHHDRTNQIPPRAQV